MSSGDFAAIAITLYAAHHVGDYWVQRDEDAKHKGDAGANGRLHCLHHVLTYLATQTAGLIVIALALGIHFSWFGISLGLIVSGVTHYTADRREHGLMFWLARRLPGKANFLRLGVPRAGAVAAISVTTDAGQSVPLDNPSLGTGAWALDQAWHIFFGVFVAALLMTVIR